MTKFYTEDPADYEHPLHPRGVRPDGLELVVGWFPRWPTSLARGAPLLMPAVLYADKVTVLSPESDDALEMPDYFDLREKVRGVRFVALSSGYARVDETGSVVLDADGRPIIEPLVPEVWLGLAAHYAREAQAAIAGKDTHRATASLARLLSLESGAHGFDPLQIAAEEIPSIDDMLLSAAREAQVSPSERVNEDVEAALMLRVYHVLAQLPGRYAVIDDPAAVLQGPERASAKEKLSGWSRVRSTEASLSTSVLRHLPSPRRQPWDVVVDIRARLDGPLGRFRVAMAKLSEAAETHPLDENFEEYAQHVWRIEVVPALDDLDDLAREASLRSVFFDDVLGDLKSYAGPMFGVLAALTDTLPALFAAAAGVAQPVGATIARYRTKRRAMRKRDYLFVREASKRLEL